LYHTLLEAGNEWGRIWQTIENNVQLNHELYHTLLEAGNEWGRIWQTIENNVNITINKEIEKKYKMIAR